MNHIKILIADDHPMMREALKTAVQDEPDMQVVGEATNGLEALDLARELAPDVLLLDLLMPKLGGLEVLERLQKETPHVKVLVVSSLEDEGKILAAVQSGALGYFPKTASRNYLLEGIRKVADGVPYLPAGIAAMLFKGLREMKVAAPEPQGSRPRHEPLTERQAEVLRLVGDGRQGAVGHRMAPVGAEIAQVGQALGGTGAIDQVGDHLRVRIQGPRHDVGLLGGLQLVEHRRAGRGDAPGVVGPDRSGGGTGAAGGIDGGQAVQGPAVAGAVDGIGQGRAGRCRGRVDPGKAAGVAGQVAQGAQFVIEQAAVEMVDEFAQGPGIAQGIGRRPGGAVAQVVCAQPIPEGGDPGPPPSATTGSGSRRLPRARRRLQSARAIDRTGARWST